MGKKNNKDGGSSPRMGMTTTVAMTGGAFLLRKLLATAWTKITGKVPPTDLADPRVTLGEALVWAVVTGVLVETLRFAVVRSTMKKSIEEASAAESS